MKNSISGLRNLFASFWRNEGGVTAAMVALSLVGILGITGFAIDMGHLLWVNRQLQAAVDSAALAGGEYVATSASQAITTATQYSSVSSSDYNYDSRIAASFVSQPSVKCLSSVTIPTCANTVSGDNGIQVKEKAVVKMWFLEVVGISSLTIQAEATASAKGGNSIPLAVEIVLDTTASMADPDNGCGISGATQETCAKAGVQALLSGLNPTIDYVGLMTFPGVDAADANDWANCSASGNPSVQAYSNTPDYTIASLGNTFKSSSSSTTLNSGNGVVGAVGTGSSGCNGGIPSRPPGGVETYYAGAINAAQSALASFKATHPTVQTVIVFLSDGDANSTTVQSNFTGYINNPTTNLSGTTLTVKSCCTAQGDSGNYTGGALAVGDIITGSGITGTVTITAFGVAPSYGSGAGAGTGGVGTYTVSASECAPSSTTKGVTTCPNTAENMVAASPTTLNKNTIASNTDECAQGVAAAQAAAAAGTWIYSIAYGAAGSGCSTDTVDTAAPAYAGITPCQTMGDIASDSTKFYSDGIGNSACSGANSISNLVALFSAISEDLSQPRLIANNAT